MIGDLTTINYFLCMLCLIFGAWAGWNIAQEDNHINKEELKQLKEEIKEAKIARQNQEVKSHKVPIQEAERDKKEDTKGKKR